MAFVNVYLQPKEGDRGFVDSAAGAVGQVVGQLLKHVYKCSRVAGSAGTKEKVSCKFKHGLRCRNVGEDACANVQNTGVRWPGTAGILCKTGG